MKFTKKGKVKLQRGDVQVGNFVFHPEPFHYKWQDINDTFSMRVASHTIIGRLIESALKARKDDPNSDNFLHDYSAVIYNTLSCVPDMEFLAAINKAAVDCVNRHKEFYGIKEDITEEENKTFLDNVKEVYEAETEAKMEVRGDAD